MLDSKGEYFIKKSTEILDFSIDYAADLGTDTISTSAWSIPTGITLVSDTKTATTSIIFLSGGTAGVEYACVNTVVTVGVRTLVKTLRIKIAPPAAVATTALITLDYFKRLMNFPVTDPDADPENERFISLINAASADIIRLTGRTFKIANFIDRFAANGQQAFLLREMPLIYVKSIHNSTQGAITLTNAAANAVSAQAWVTQARALNLQVVGGASDGLLTIDLTAAAYDTLNELVTGINLIGSGWAAVLHSDATGYEPSEDLIESTAVKIASSGTTLEMLGPAIDASYQVDFDAGMIYVNLPLPSGFCSSPYWCWVKYRAGYTTIPEGLQLITARYALALQDELDRDASLESERIGDYSYTRGSGDSSNVLLALEGQLQSWKARRL